jgi:hypothetical protein
MRVLLVLAAALAALVLPSTGRAAPPSNDAFADAKPIGVLPFSETEVLTEATTEAGEAGGCFGPSQTAWWSYTPSADTVIRADTFGSTIPGSYVVLWKSEGSGPEGLTSLDCAGYWTSFSEKLRAGTTYYLQAGSFYGSFSGDVTLNVAVEPPPEYDDITTAKTIPSVAYSDSSGDSSFATTAPSDPDCFGKGSTVWYVFVPYEDMRLEASLQPLYGDAPSDFTLAAFRGEPEALTQFDCSDDSLLVQGYPKPHIEFDAKGGVPVYFMVGTANGTEGGQYFFTVQRPLEVTVPVSTKAQVTKSGIATISGAMSCSRISSATVLVMLRQTFAGRLSAFGTGQVSMPCGVSAAQWSLELTSWPVLFGPGTADVELYFQSSCDLEGCQPGARYDESSYNRREFTRVQVKRG